MSRLDIEIKEDSAEKLVAITGKPTKNFLMAGEFNEVVEAVNEDHDKIDVLQGLQNLKTNFTGQAYAVWTGVGLIYDVIYPDYYLAGVLYPAGNMQVTLAPSDSVYDRKDAIVVGVSGAYAKTGELEDVAITPTVDPNTEIYITTADVPAGATTPGDTSEESIYKENAEWTASSTNGTVNFNATAVPFQGTKHIDCGAFTNNQYLQFVDSGTNQITDFDLISFRLNLKNTFSNNTYFTVQFFNGTTLVGSKAIPSGSYNFVRTVINSYQQVVVPLNELTLSSSTFDRIRIAMNGSNASGFRLDNIILSKGSSVATPLQNSITSIVTDSGIVNATQKDDSIQFKGIGSLIISAVGKIVSFAVDLSNYYTKAEIDSKLVSAYIFQTNKTNYADLVATGVHVVGYVYNVLDTGINYAWNGTDWDDLGGIMDISGKEDTSNKTGTVIGNESSTSKYLHIAGAVAYFQQKLTDSSFGTFINSLTAKPTPIDADSISIVDSADSNKQKKTLLSDFKAFLLEYFRGQIEVNSSTAMQANWKGKLILFTANCTITVPASLADSYAWEGYTMAGVTVAWAITSPKTWENATPSATPEKTSIAFFQRGSTNSVILLQ